MAASNRTQELGDHVPLAVVTAHEPVGGNRWITERWRVLGVLAGATIEAAGAKRTLLRAGPEGEHYLWSGFTLALTKADAESYYYNLLGDNPSVYVYGKSDDSGELIPLAVTLEYIDAMAHSESGNATFAVSMPPELYKRVEQFVLDHYVPEEPRSQRKHEAEQARRHGPQD